jgi:hypothetical protein
MKFEIQFAAVTGGFAACHVPIPRDKCEISSEEVIQDDGLSMWLSMKLSVFKISHRSRSILELSLELAGDRVATVVRHDAC